MYLSIALDVEGVEEALDLEAADRLRHVPEDAHEERVRARVGPGDGRRPGLRVEGAGLVHSETELRGRGHLTERDRGRAAIRRGRLAEVEDHDLVGRSSDRAEERHEWAARDPGERAGRAGDDRDAGIPKGPADGHGR